MGGKFNGNIFLSLGKMPAKNLSNNYLQSKTRYARFRLILNLTRMQISEIWACNRTVPTAYTFWLVLFSCGLAPELINGSQLGLARFSQRRLDPSPNGITIDRVHTRHDQAKTNGDLVVHVRGQGHAFGFIECPDLGMSLPGCFLVFYLFCN